MKEIGMFSIALPCFVAAPSIFVAPTKLAAEGPLEPAKNMKFARSD
jgi:hypothetical protein